MFQPDLPKGKRILVTGGDTGLGRSMVQRYLELGANVVICGRREDVLAATAEELGRQTGGGGANTSAMLDWTDEQWDAIRPKKKQEKAPS